MSHGFRNTSTGIHNWLFPAYTCLSLSSIQIKTPSMTVKTIYFCTTCWIRKSFIGQLNINQGELSQYEKCRKNWNLGGWVPYVCGWELEHTSSETWEEGQNGRGRKIGKRADLKQEKRTKLEKEEDDCNWTW